MKSATAISSNNLVKVTVLNQLYQIDIELDRSPLLVRRTSWGTGRWRGQWTSGPKLLPREWLDVGAYEPLKANK
jgi:hypothetical protein